MNSKFLKLALCLGLFAGVMNNTSFSMEGEEEEEEELVDPKNIQCKGTKKVFGNLYEKNTEVDLFTQNYSKMVDNENDMSLAKLDELIKETQGELDMEADIQNLPQMLSVLKFNNEFLPKARTFYRDTADSYKAIKGMFTQEENAYTKKFQELNEEIDNYENQIKQLYNKIEDLTEKRNYIKEGYQNCFNMIKSLRQQKENNVVAKYLEGRHELSDLTTALQQKINNIQKKYDAEISKINADLQTYNDVKSVADFNNKKGKKKKKRMNLNNNSKISSINEEPMEFNSNTKKSTFDSYGSYVFVNQDGKEEKKERKQEDKKENEKEVTINEENNNNNIINEDYNEDFKDI